MNFKNILKLNMIALCVSGASFMGAANAADTGTIDIHAVLVSTTCSVDATSIASPVNLGDSISPASFTSVGQTSTKVPFSIRVTDCSAAVTPNVSFYASGTKDSTNDALLALSTAGVTGLGVAIYDDADLQINMGTSSKNYPVNVETGEATISLKAALMSTAVPVVGTGAIAAQTAFNLTYN